MELRKKFSAAAAVSLRALNMGFVCRWSDRTEVEFQNWAEASAFGPRRDRMCVTMSSSSGKRVSIGVCVLAEPEHESKVLMALRREVVEEEV